MKLRLMFSLMTTLILSVTAGAVMAEESGMPTGSQVVEDPMMDGSMMMGEDNSMMMDETEATVTEVGNTICPIEGEKIGAMGEPAKVEHMGKMYNLCCVNCLSEFQKDPDKYAKMAEESMMEEDSMMQEEPMDSSDMNTEQTAQ